MAQTIENIQPSELGQLGKWKSAATNGDTENNTDANNSTPWRDLPKRATRSKRLTKPKKEFDSSPSSKKQLFFTRKLKEEKPADDVVVDNLIKKRVSWRFEDKNLFFEALLEHGKDFDAIENFMSQKVKKKGVRKHITKSKEQIRHFYYRTWHKISPFINHSSTDETKKQTIELQGVLCYGEMRKKIFAKFDEKFGQKLNELVHKGSAIMKLRGKKIVVRAPSCKAIKKHLYNAEFAYQLKMLPEKVNIELTPKNNRSWSFVQNLSQNPRICVLVRLNHSVSSLINFLQQKWSQVDIIENENKMKLKIFLPPNTSISPSNIITSEPDISNVISAKCKSESHVSDLNCAENKSLHLDSAGEAENFIQGDNSVNNHSDKRKLQQGVDDGTDDDLHKEEVGVSMETDEKRVEQINGSVKKDEDNRENKEMDEISRKLLVEGLDEVTGGHMSVAKLLIILSCPEVIKLEYDWMEQANQITINNKEGNQVNKSNHSIVSPRSSSPITSSFLNPRLRRLLQVACTEYYAALVQKSKETKAKESKCSLSSVSMATTSCLDGSAGSSNNNNNNNNNNHNNNVEVFRVPENFPPRILQSSKNSEKKIVDHNLLQQMPIFQKKPDMLINRRCRKQVVRQKNQLSNSNCQRPLLPLNDISDGRAIGGHMTQSSSMIPPSTSFGNLKTIISMHASSSSLITSAQQQQQPSIFSTTKLPPTTTASPASKQTKLITMEPSELKPSVRRIIPITLNKTSNIEVPPPTSQMSNIPKVITGTDVFLLDKILEDNVSSIIHTNACMAENNVPISLSGAGKSVEPANVSKQHSVEEQWLNGEDLSLPSFLHDLSSNPPTSNGFTVQQFFLSESSRDSNLLGKFDVDTNFQCLMNESSLDYASKFADVAAQFSIPTSSLFSSSSVTVPPSLSSLKSSAGMQPSYSSFQMITSVTSSSSCSFLHTSIMPTKPS